MIARTMDDTRSVVERYFRAWTTNDVPAAYALLADELEFVGPTASYRSADAFRPALVAFAAMSKGAQLIELLIDGNRAAMLYSCQLPFGTARIASFFRVEHGKIRWYETQFDATELRRLQAQK